jgi:pSer/pThr/pTyr-binding forkhead associated (FHA) protein
MSGVSANPPTNAQLVSELTARLEAERAGTPFLLYRDGDDRQQLFRFQPGSAGVSVGRRPPSDLLLDWDDQVSRLHARFEPLEDDWEVVDDGLSRNGTLVNEERVSGRRRLRDGDTLRFGATTITFRSPEHGPAGTSSAAETPAAVELSSTQRRVLVALCRPYLGRSPNARPATDQQIADELYLSVGAVKTHLRVLCAKLDVDELSRNDTRFHLAQRALSAGLISEHDL